MDECQGVEARRSAEPSETLTEAAELLEVATRHARSEEALPCKALVHGNSAVLRTEPISRRENYAEGHERFGPTLASEHLAPTTAWKFGAGCSPRVCGAAVASANRIAPGANAKRTSAS